jgi:phage-related minor tail protein
VFGNLLPGIFGTRATGGPVMAGKPYVVGERGPELFVPSGPGTVVANDRLGGGGGPIQVVYNIQAVDAMSFKQLVARDPEFIYSVTQAGARRLPR